MNKYLKIIFVGIFVLLIAGAFIYFNTLKQFQTNPDLKVIGIATFVSHPALDSLLDNIKKELSKQGFIENKNIKYEIRNANGEIQLISSIARDIAAFKPSVTVAITTPVAQALIKTAKGPFVFSSVTDPVGSGLIKSLDIPEKIITGASDAWPYDKQLSLIREISPNAKRILVIFNPSDTASQYGMKQIRKHATEHGFILVEAAVNASREVYTVAETLARGVDAIFLSSDSTAIGGVSGAAKVAIRHQIPLYVGDSGTVKKGGLAAASIGYDKLGVETGKLIARVLKGEHYIPIVSPNGVAHIVVNTKAAQLMGVKIPKSTLKKATIIDEIVE